MHFRRLERSDLEHFQIETFPPCDSGKEIDNRTQMNASQLDCCRS